MANDDGRWMDTLIPRTVNLCGFVPAAMRPGLRDALSAWKRMELATIWMENASEKGEGDMSDETAHSHHWKPEYGYGHRYAAHAAQKRDRHG